MDELLTTEDLAKMLKMAPDTMVQWRFRTKNTGRQVGPKHIKINKQIRYKKSWVEKWLKGLENAN